ncbi:MAG: molybdopterin-dependent oxidoreductase [Gammaproteobacteria bacterium]|nr:molybdopterin-dependent oxidoreductase [Gammaproteobacteria bacterium]
MSEFVNINRRRFLQSSAAACISFALPVPAFSRQDMPLALTAWVTVNPDNTIIIQSPAAEMGQGSMTALPMIFAEEFDADWSKVQIETSPANDAVFLNPTPWVRGIMLTLGSSTVSGYYDSLRHYGAQARKILLMSVASNWNVPLSELSTEPSVVIHPASARSITYGEIIPNLKISNALPEIKDSDLKSEDDFRIIGSKIPRYDVPAKVNGSAIYSIDVDLPGMLYATVLHSPVKGGEPLKVHNEAALLQRPGILRVVKLKDAIAIVADNYQAAYLAEKDLKADWSEVEKLKNHSSEPSLTKHLAMVSNPELKGLPIQEKGNITEALSQAAASYQSEYLSDYFYHAHLEPLNAVADVKTNGSVEVWAGTQAPTHCTRSVAAELGIDVSKVNLHRSYLGGAFGRRGGQDHDFVIDAVQLSREMQKPVKVIWSRESDVKCGRFKPIKAVKMQAVEDATGKLIGWHHRTASDEALKQSDPYRYEKAGGWPVISSGGMDTDYEIDNVLAEILDLDTGVRAAPMRGIGGTVNKFAAECFLDEIALAKKQDSLELRLSLLQEQTLPLKVLNRVAEMSGWHNRKKGAGYGVAFQSAYYPTAYVVQVTLDENTGLIRVAKVWVALYVGIAIHPDNIIAQLEGQIIFAISNTLKERITMRDGVVEQSNFHDYPIMRMNEVPEIEIDILTRKNSKPLGVGDSRCEVIPAAIANAFADLSGKRLYHLPLTPERVLAL